MDVKETISQILDNAIAQIAEIESTCRTDSVIKSAMTLSLNQLIAQMEGGNENGCK